MRTVNLPLLLLAAALAAPAQAAVTVTVTGDPDRFADAGDRNSDPRKVVQDLARYLKSLGDKNLPAGTNLTIEILDLDRAGRPRMNMPTEIRIMTGKADAPFIDLRYSLEKGGRVAKAARERVCDMDYLRPAPLRSDQHDPLVYEKRMLEEWFRERFVPR